VGGAFGSGILLRSTSCIHAVVAASCSRPMPSADAFRRSGFSRDNSHTHASRLKPLPQEPAVRRMGWAQRYPSSSTALRNKPAARARRWCSARPGRLRHPLGERVHSHRDP